MKCRSSAIVLKRYPYGESDLIVSFFSREYGKLKGIAKGARRSRKRFGPSLQLGSEGELSFTRGGTSQLVRLDGLDAILPKSSPESLENISYMIQLLELTELFLPEAVISVDKYDLLSASLSKIRTNEFCFRDMIAFKLAWLEKCGYLPNFISCSLCGRPFVSGKWSFSILNAGLTCGSCSKSTTTKYISELGLNLLRNSDMCREIPLESCLEVGDILAAYCEYVLDRPLKTQKFLRDILQDKK